MIYRLLNPDIDILSMQIQAGDHLLYGEWLLPKKRSGRIPAVICCHGYGGSYQLYKHTVGKVLSKAGFAVFCFDFYGGSRRTRSGGSMQEMSVFTEQEDLRCVIRHVSQLDFVDATNLFLMGESQGGFVASITAPHFHQQIRAMVLYYPAFCIPDDARKRFPNGHVPEIYKAVGQTVGRIYSEALLSYDVYKHIGGYDQPVLIIHGDADPIVDVSFSRRASKIYANARLEILRGENHGFTKKGKRRAANLSCDFLEAQKRSNCQ